MRRFRTGLALGAMLMLLFTSLAQAAGPNVTPLNLGDCNLPAHWAAPYACDLQHQGIALETGLDQPVPRREFLRLLTTALGGTPTSLDASATLPPGGYDPAVAGTAPISREDAVTLIALAVANLAETDVDLRILQSAADAASLSDYARLPVAFAMSRGALEGRPGAVLDPQAPLSLGAAAKLLSLMLPERLPEGIDKVTILSYNDFHGHLFQDSRKRPGNDLGAERLTTAILGQALENPNLLLLDIGDTFQGTPISNLVQGESVQEWRNSLGVDAGTLGNHEFDWARETMLKLMNGAEFPVVSANIFVKQTGERPEWLKPSAMATVGGYQVGLIGITTPQTAEIVLPANVADLEFRDPAPVIDEQAKALRSQGADLIVVMLHAVGSPGSKEPARVEGDVATWFANVHERVDAVMAGHSHELTAGYVLNANGEIVPVAQGGYYGRALARVELYIDKATGQVTRAVPAYLLPSPNLAPAPAVSEALARWNAAVKPLQSRPVGKLAAPILHNWSENPSGESALGDLIADSMLTAAPGIEIALVNGGGIRAHLEGGEDGTVTWGDLYTIEPFGNTLVTVEMTGAQLQETLEIGLESYVRLLQNAESGHRPIQVAGIRFTWDYAAPAGERVTAIELSNGQPLDPAGSYTVVVNNFMATGGDDLSTLKALSDKQIDLGVIDLDVFVDYFAALSAGGPVSYDLQERIKVLNFPAQ